MKPSRSWLLAPVLFWTFLFIVLPLCIVFAISLSTRSLTGELLWQLTFENYFRASTLQIGKVAFLSIELALFNTLACLAIGYPLSIFLTGISNKKIQNFFLLLILIPFWTNFLIRTSALGNILGDEGLINRFLLSIHLISTPIDLLYSKKAIVIGLLSNYLPFMVLPLYVSLEKLDRSLIEAAHDLGATPLRAFLKVTWPLSLPGVLAGCLMVFIPSLGEFIVPDLLGGGRYLLLGNLLQQKFLVVRDWPLGSAISVLISIFLLGALFYLYRTQDQHEEVA